MNYIYLINNFWKLAAMQNFSNFEMALYFYLLDKCNKSRWQLPITINSGSIIDFFCVHRHTLQTALEKLDNFTNVKIVKNKGSKFLKVDIENGQVFENIGQVFTQKVDIENGQVFDDTEKVVQQLDIENGQLLENSNFLHYNNNKNIKYKNIYINKNAKKEAEKLQRKNLSENLQNFLNDQK